MNATNSLNVNRAKELEAMRRIRTPPVKFGDAPIVRVWDATDQARASDLPNPDDSSVRSWLIYAPWMHPFWSFHYAGLIHLRDIEGGKPVHKAFPTATHEFMVFALNPDSPPTLDPFSIAVLEPISIVQQFVAASDAAALSAIECLFSKMAIGQLSVDSDYRSEWRKLLTEATPAGRNHPLRQS